ncbi:ribonuclease H-like domain-containing protein [Mycena epipterygia]|nr:ribonuclease H-like domain-containing protein [Mycena epipterygia]
MVALQTFLAPRFYLTLSFDGWSSHAHDEIYTFHTTLPSRWSFLTAGHVFKGVSVTAAALFDVVEKCIFASFKAKSYSAVVGDGGPNVRAAKKLISSTYIWILNIYDPCHNLNLFLKDLGKLFKAELGIVSAISNFFGQSNIGTAQLAMERERQGIVAGMKSASDTRFGTTFIQTRAVQHCVPALVTCVVTGTITFATAATKWLVPYLKPGPTHYAFLAQLDSMVKLFEAGANGITTLEGQNTTCADVFYVWVTIAWHLNKLLGDLNSGLSNYRDRVIKIYNARFDQMMTESSHRIFLFAYFLHPCECGGLLSYRHL